MNILIAEDDIITCRALERNIRDWFYVGVLAKNGKRENNEKAHRKHG